MAAKDRLNSNSRSAGSVGLNVTPPPVRVKMPAIQPQVNIPEIRIPEIKIPAMDTAPIASAIRAIGGAIQELGAQQQRLAEQHAELLAAIKQLAGKPTGAARPKNYYVDFDKEDGQTVGMRVEVR